MSKAAAIENLVRKLEDKGFNPEFLEFLNEAELSRLLENCNAKNSIIQVTVALDSESDLPEIFQETKSFCEIITTNEDLNGNPEKIRFHLICAIREDDLAKLKGFFDGKNYTKEVKNLP